MTRLDPSETPAGRPKSADCPVCRAPGRVLPRRLYDDRFGYPGSFVVRGCAACRHHWLETDFDAASLDRLYGNYYLRSNVDLSAFQPAPNRPGLAGWWHGDRARPHVWVPPGSRVLDIGCGLGETLAYHRQRGSSAIGVEIDANAQRFASHYRLEIHAGPFRVDRYATESFDVVTLDQVIEHAIDPVTLLHDVATLIAPSGRIVLATPDGDAWMRRWCGQRWLHWHAPYHLHIFSPRSLAIAAAQAGLEVEDSASITSLDWMRLQLAHLVARPKLGASSPLFDPRAACSAPRRLAMRAISKLARLGFAAAMARGLDAIGRGDNRVYVLTRSRIASKSARG